MTRLKVTLNAGMRRHPVSGGLLIVIGIEFVPGGGKFVADVVWTPRTSPQGNCRDVIWRQQLTLRKRKGHGEQATPNLVEGQLMRFFHQTCVRCNIAKARCIAYSIGGNSEL
eukprot:3710863-Amphidinium_carterae.1